MFSLLLIDDEEFALSALQHALPWEKFGFTDIRTTTSAPKAWELLRQERIDACFVDIRMPGMSGLELLTAARQEHLETLFVVVSGYSDFTYARQALQLGALDYCLKPVSEEDCRPVLEKLAAHIPLSRISHDPAFASILLTEQTFCQNFLSGLWTNAAAPEALTLLLIRSAHLIQVLMDVDIMRPARVLFLGEEEALLIWKEALNEEQFVSFSADSLSPALFVYGTISPTAVSFQSAFRRMQTICHSQDAVSPALVRLPAVSKETSSYLADILVFIEENYARHLTLQNLASHFGINYSYLSQLFKKATNQTFTEHLTNIRLAHACQLLSDTYMPIVNIAETVGFPDYHYFCNTFKRHYSMTPSQYRDTPRKDEKA